MELNADTRCRGSFLKEDTTVLVVRRDPESGQVYRSNHCPHCGRDFWLVTGPNPHLPMHLPEKPAPKKRVRRKS